MRTYRQDSDDARNYAHDWSQELDADSKITGIDPSVATSAWTVTSGLTSAGATIDGCMTYIKLSGGTVNTSYKVENKITTSGGMTHTKSFYVQVVNK